VINLKKTNISEGKKTSKSKKKTLTDDLKNIVGVPLQKLLVLRQVYKLELSQAL